jgi:hypothetical protein
MSGSAGIAEDRKGWLFRTSCGHDATALSGQPMNQPDAWRMIRRGRRTKRISNLDKRSLPTAKPSDCTEVNGRSRHLEIAHQWPSYAEFFVDRDRIFPDIGFWCSPAEAGLYELRLVKRRGQCRPAPAASGTQQATFDSLPDE